MLTISDFLPEWAKSTEALLSSPTEAELNSAEIPPFVKPSEPELLQAKQLLSYEAWLYLMKAHERAVSYDYAQGEQDVKNYLTRLIALLSPEFSPEFKSHTSLSNPVVRARIRWVHQRLLDDSLPKSYYQQAAEAATKQARHQVELAAVQAAVTGETPSGQSSIASTGIAARGKWSRGVHHPEFGTWFVQELLRRPIGEMEAYLNVEWRVDITGESKRPGDWRQVVVPDELPYLCELLKAAANANPSAKLALKRARSRFMQRTETSLIADVTEAPAQLALGLSMRKIALLEFYQGRPIRNDARACKLAQENGHNSASSPLILVKKYNYIKHETNITGVDGKALQPMLDDLLVVQHILGKGKNFKLDNHILILERKK